MNNHAETKEILKVVQNYKDGTFKARVDLLNGVFHEKAVMNGWMGSDLLLAVPSVWIDDVGANPSMESKGDPYQLEVEQVYIEGDVASVIISESGYGGTTKFVDFLHLIKIDGKWSVIHKLFTTV